MLQMAVKLKYADDGLAYGFGNLSIREIMSSATSICPSVSFTADVEKARTSSNEVILLWRKHYYLFLPTKSGRFIYDSLGPLHAYAHLGHFVFGNTNNIRYQDRHSDTCGLFVLHCLLCFTDLTKKSAVNNYDIVDCLEQYFSNDYTANEFNITLFGVCMRIGEEFSTPSYSKTRAMLMLCED